MSLYFSRGVSAHKEEVHLATASLDKGLYPFAFCKIYPDFLGGDAEWVNLMHADGAGTKSILAYLYWKETGDISVWKDIARDAVAMNFDDLKSFSVNIHFLGGETADVGDLVRTIAVNGTMMARWPRSKIINNEKIV